MIRLIKPYIKYSDVEADFKQIFASGWFTKGQYVEQFRESIKKRTDADYAFLTTSATTALWSCLKLLDIKEGDEVIAADFSYPATVNVIEDLGAIPVFVDVNEDTFNMSSTALERRISSKTKAVIYVDSMGNPSGIHAIKAICDAHGIPLIEDAACAIGSSEDQQQCGQIADLTCFSFHPRKLLTTGEGGAITTNNEKFAQWLDVKLNHGAVYQDGRFDFVSYGYNFRLTEMQAVMGIKQLENLDSIITTRNRVRRDYIEQLQPLGFSPQIRGEGVVHNIQSLVFKVPQGVDRDQLVARLKSKGIETTLATYCMSGTTYYREKYNDVQPISASLEGSTITFPCYEGVPVLTVTNAVRACL